MSSSLYWDSVWVPNVCPGLARPVCAVALDPGAGRQAVWTGSKSVEMDFWQEEDSAGMKTSRSRTLVPC